VEQTRKLAEATAEKVAEQTLNQTNSGPAPAQRSWTVADPRVNRMLFLQRTIGNRAVCRMIQAKLEVSQPGDPLEQEADQVAQRIVSMPAPDSESVAYRQVVADDKEKDEGSLKISRAVDADLDNGVLPHAEEAVSAASASAGQPLPANLRRKFQQALGVDLSAVRTHTGPESVEANRAISARAYATGSDIHFNERQYNPDTLDGQELLAHEVTHIVQQGGNAISRKVSRPAGVDGVFSRQVLQRDPNDFPYSSFPTPIDKSTPKDMVEMNWTPMAAASQGPDQPTAIAIDLGPVPPMPALPPKTYQAPDCKGLNCHAPVGKLSDPSQMFMEMERSRVWNVLKGDIAKTVESFNRTAPLISKYNDASKDPALADVYGIPAKGPGDLGSKVEGKVVGGKDDKSGTTVGGVFGTGTTVDTKDLDSKIDKAAKGDVNSPLAKALNNFKAVDQEFNKAASAVIGATAAAKSAGHEAEAAHLLIEEQKATEEKEKAEKELAEAKEKVEKVKKYVGYAIKGVAFVAGLVLAPEVAIPAAAAGAAGGAGKEEEKKGGLPEGAAEKATMAAEKAIDFWYAGDMAKAAANVASASAALKAAHSAYLKENEMAKVDALAGKLADVNTAMLELKAQINARRLAYREVATAAAAAIGGTPQQQQKIQAMINAIPACEAVVTSTSNIVDSIADVPYSQPSGVAFGMAFNSSNAAAGAALSFTDNLGYLRGYKATFRARNAFWNARLSSARQIMTRLGKDKA
jgi:hypothetical protein